jgi:polyhydroxyalkanoate synthesis regulator phasin
MRQVKSFTDVNLVLKDIFDKLDELKTRDINLKKRRCRNASPSLDDYDYVVRKELAELYDRINKLESRVKKNES